MYSECNVNPCNNSGICQYHAGSYMCTCLLGYSGLFCDIQLPPTSTSSTSRTAVIVGVVLAIVCAIMLAVSLATMLLCYHRYRRRHINDGKYRNSGSSANVYENVGYGNNMKMSSTTN